MDPSLYSSGLTPTSSTPAWQTGRFQKMSGQQAADGDMTKTKLAETTLLLEVLVKVNALITTSKSFEAFCIETIKILRDKLQFKRIDIWIKDEKNPSILRLISPDPNGSNRTMSIHTGIIGKAIREMRTICVPDVSQNPDYIVATASTKSELCIPLKHNSEPIGAINIETDVNQTFEWQKPVIEIIAENLSHSMKLAMLYKTEEQFHRLVEHMEEGVWVGDEKWRTIYANPTMQKMLGMNAEEMLGKTPEDYVDDRGKKSIRMAYERLKQGQSGRYETHLVSKNNEQIPILIHVVPFGENNTMATITDLRPVKTAEKKLKQTERLLNSITRYCPEAIMALDLDTIIQSWSVGAENMFGYKSSEIIGKAIDIIIPPDRLETQEKQNLIKEINIKSLVRNFETTRLHKNGNSVTVSLTATAIKDENNIIIGYSVLYKDITTQKKWERELQDRFEKIQDAYREIGKQRRHLDYLMDIINIASSNTHNKQQVATFIVNAIVMITKVDGASLRLLDNNIGKLVLVAQSGLGEEWWAKKIIPYTDSLLESAVENGQPLKILDILSEPKYPSPSLARKHNLRSALVIPLQTKGEVIGSLMLYLSQDGNLNLLDDEFISVFAQQASIALKLAK